MLTLNPQTQEVDFANRLIDMMMQRRPDELELRRVEAGLHRLLRRRTGDAATCYHAISLARILHGDRAGALDAARNAMHANPVSPALLVNLISTFLDLGKLDDAALVADRYRNSFKGDRSVLTAMLLAYAYAFRLEDALEVCRECDVLRDHAPGFHACSAASVAVGDLMRLRDEHGYTGDTLKGIFNAAVDVLIEAGASPLRFSRAVVPDGSVMHHFHVDRSLEQCAALDCAIAERLGERFERTGLELMSLTCLPLSTYHDLLSVSLTG
ncbi:hypothetical protein [Cupriavidus plantarum]|uniref:hypothetical protein n=1 Tax=Cupriavidus plantarum TaxID=942865 RepID=UPI0015C929E4|nr:hypothetical protein [Cupriavidus plantarum]NYH99603.1 tetratricopeptide (TPR) repeat protein [Cupriavidus plantarum]